MIVREATEDDLAQLAGLFHKYRHFYGFTGDSRSSVEFIAERMTKLDSTLIVAGADRLAGFSQLYPLFSSVSACRISLLNDLYVDESARGRGIGTALLEASRKSAIANGSKRLLIATQKHNEGASRLYRRFGFSLDEEFDHFELPLLSV